MPRKRKPRFSAYGTSALDRIAIRDRVVAALEKFDAVRVLPDEARDRLIDHLVDAICFARGGIKAGRRHVSDRAMEKHVFISDVARALGRAGLPAARWQHDHDDRESLLYRVAHALGGAFGLHLPQDLGPLAARATQIRYGEMPPAKVEQDADIENVIL
jgi:hypothetical protein